MADNAENESHAIKVKVQASLNWTANCSVLNSMPTKSAKNSENVITFYRTWDKIIGLSCLSITTSIIWDFNDVKAVKTGESLMKNQSVADKSCHSYQQLLTTYKSCQIDPMPNAWVSCAYWNIWFCMKIDNLTLNAWKYFACF